MKMNQHGTGSMESMGSMLTKTRHIAVVAPVVHVFDLAAENDFALARVLTRCGSEKVTRQVNVDHTTDWYGSPAGKPNLLHVPQRCNALQMHLW